VLQFSPDERTLYFASENARSQVTIDPDTGRSTEDLVHRRAGARARILNVATGLRRNSQWLPTINGYHAAP
jgi:hypothetical protein